ncbi:oligosaccharide flippase family protein [Planctomycetota bacterium]|nr:oligosaccharide flippase family protein [Planctomycetota bacterium]
MTAKSLLRNTSFVLIAKIINAAFSLAAFLIIARSLKDVAEMGLYTFTLSVSSVVTTLANWGGNEHLFRRGAAVPYRISRMLSVTSRSRAVLGLAIGILVTAALTLARGESTVALALPLALVVMFIDTQSVAYVVSFRARGNMTFEGWLYGGRGALKLAGIGLVCSFTPALEAVLLCLIAVNTVGLVFCRYFDRHQYKAQSNRISLRYARAFLSDSTPYLVMGIYSMMLLQLSVLILGALSNDTEVGLFGVAFQVFQALLIVPAAFNVALQPVLVKSFEADKSKWERQVRKLILITTLPMLGLGLGLAAFLPVALPVIFGERYLASSEVLRILMLAFGLRVLWSTTLFPAFVSGKLLKHWNRLLLVTLVIQSLLTAAAVRTYGATGAAYGALMADGLIFLVGTVRLYTLTGYRESRPTI